MELEGTWNPVPHRTRRLPNAAQPVGGRAWVRTPRLSLGAYTFQPHNFLILNIGKKGTPFLEVVNQAVESREQRTHPGGGLPVRVEGVKTQDPGGDHLRGWGQG